MKSFFSKAKTAASNAVVGAVSVRTAHAPGHFYSPVVNPDEAYLIADNLWPKVPHEVLGIDFDPQGHESILREDFPRFIQDYRYADDEKDAASSNDYYTNNSQFGWLDSRALFVLMRKWQPKRIIEVGSGFSSLLMADVNRRFLNDQCEITCVEPFPRPFLQTGVPGIAALLEKNVQDVPLAFFNELQSGDILFIDSSHVAKTGSDVNYLFFEVLPRLNRGVRIHIHDVFLPNEYPRDWVIDENRSWNEQYVFRALLMYSTAFRVVFGCSYAFATMPSLVKTALNHPKGHAFSGGSIWIEKFS
jgi:predicted O-methyltransferase YrrM